MGDKLNIGEKIKKRRLELGLTQKEVCEDCITRNMLSLIESGAATPSIETAIYLADRLSLPLPYLFSKDDSLFLYEKEQKINIIRNLLKKEDYNYCIKILDSLSGSDDEVNFIYAYAAFNHGKKLLLAGSLVSGAKYLNLALEKSLETVYDTSYIEQTVPLYLSIASNIQSPLLELDSEAYEKSCLSSADYEFFKYVTMDVEFDFENILYSKHLYAKSLLKRYNYAEAISVLLELQESKNYNYNAYVLFGVYTDLENAYKQLGDFENAYRYSTKRMSLISAFKT